MDGQHCRSSTTAVETRSAVRKYFDHVCTSSGTAMTGWRSAGRPSSRNSAATTTPPCCKTSTTICTSTWLDLRPADRYLSAPPPFSSISRYRHQRSAAKMGRNGRRGCSSWRNAWQRLLVAGYYFSISTRAAQNCGDLRQSSIGN